MGPTGVGYRYSFNKRPLCCIGLRGVGDSDASLWRRRDGILIRVQLLGVRYFRGLIILVDESQSISQIGQTIGNCHCATTRRMVGIRDRARRLHHRLFLVNRRRRRGRHRAGMDASQCQELAVMDDSTRPRQHFLVVGALDHEAFGVGEKFEARSFRATCGRIAAFAIHDFHFDVSQTHRVRWSGFAGLVYVETVIRQVEPPFFPTRPQPPPRELEQVPLLCLALFGIGGFKRCGGCRGITIILVILNEKMVGAGRGLLCWVWFFRVDGDFRVRLHLPQLEKDEEMAKTKLPFKSSAVELCFVPSHHSSTNPCQAPTLRYRKKVTIIPSWVL